MSWRNARRGASVSMLGALMPVGLGAMLLFGCSNVRGSAVGTDPNVAAYQGQVQIVVLQDPQGHDQVGLIEASGYGSLEELVIEFKKQAAGVGGSVVKLDSMRTTFRMEQRTQNESYSCGTSTAPRTCNRTVTRQVEVAETTMVGRAFRPAP